MMRSASCPRKVGVAELCFLKFSSTLSEMEPFDTVPLNRALLISCQLFRSPCRGFGQSGLTSTFIRSFCKFAIAFKAR